MPTSPHTLERHCAPREPHHTGMQALMNEGFRIDPGSILTDEQISAVYAGPQAACVHGMEDAAEQMNERKPTPQQIGEFFGEFAGWIFFGGLLGAVALAFARHKGWL